MERTILHCDCNAYFASVECIAHPELRDVPMAVCGDPQSRHGIILAKNELAKAFGIQTAETIWQAQKKCPQLVLAAAHHFEYSKYCKLINEIYLQYTSRVEAFSIDESWLDVTGSLHLFGSGKEIADTLRQRIKDELGLTISVGVSFNKVFAKLGSDYKKPNATTVITRENYRDILYPLPVTDMLFVGKRSAEALARIGVHTIGALAALKREDASNLLGKSGELVWEYANGLDESPVREFGQTDPIKSIGNSITFRRNLNCLEDVKAGILLLADSVGARLRAAGLYCMTVQVQIKDPQFHVISRQKTLAHPIHLTKDLSDAGREIISQAWNMEKPIRLLSLTAANLTDNETSGQITFFDESADRSDKREKLETAVDKIRKMFGKKAVSYASVLKTDIIVQPDDADATKKQPSPKKE
ncbi:MAG: DNA polymerase IV [Christensenella sp.]